MRPAARRMSLVLALLATLAAAWLAPGADDDGLVPPATRGAPAQAQAQAGHVADGGDAQVEVLRVLARGLAEPGPADGAFGVPAWRRASSPARPVPQAPASQVAPAAPVAPQAPPLPFKVMGRYEEAGKTAVFLLHGEQGLMARAGDVLAKDYRVEALSDTVLTLRYLPLDQLQELALPWQPG